MDILRQTFHIDQKMHRKFPHLLILIYRARIDAEKQYAEKKTQRSKITGVKIAWVEMKSNEYPLFYINDFLGNLRDSPVYGPLDMSHVI